MREAPRGEGGKQKAELIILRIFRSVIVIEFGFVWTVEIARTLHGLDFFLWTFNFRNGMKSN